MSVRVMSLVWDVPFPTSTQMLIALKLADYSNDSGTSIFPANETLAKKARCSESTVKATLKVLRECGLLHLLRKGGSGPKDTNEWALNLPLLQALAAGTCTIEGCSTALEINGEQPVDTKGSESDPLGPLRGQSDELRGQPTGSKGSAHRPQSTNNHQIDSSAREHAQGSDKFVFQGSAKAEFAISLADSAQWSAWMHHLRLYDEDLAKRAEAAGVIKVTSRWPREGERLVSIPKPAGLSDRSKQMTGN